MAVTIALVRTHGVRQLLVYCLGKREGDWPCHHQGTLPVGRFRADEILGDIESRCRCTVCASVLMRSLEILKAVAAALSADGDGLTCGLTTASSKRRDKASAG
jgi:hypothetical protein